MAGLEVPDFLPAFDRLDVMVDVMVVRSFCRRLEGKIGWWRLAVLREDRQQTKSHFKSDMTFRVIRQGGAGRRGGRRLMR